MRSYSNIMIDNIVRYTGHIIEGIANQVLDPAELSKSLKINNHIKQGLSISGSGERRDWWGLLLFLYID